MGFRKKVKGYRVTGGDFDQFGIWQDGQKTAFSFYASVQPLTTNERSQYVALMPEGASQYSQVKLYTNYQLRTKKHATSVSDGNEGDLFEWLGKLYEVVAVMPYQSGVISHYKAIGQEVKRVNDESANEDKGVFEVSDGTNAPST